MILMTFFEYFLKYSGRVYDSLGDCFKYWFFGAGASQGHTWLWIAFEIFMAIVVIFVFSIDPNKKD